MSRELLLLALTAFLVIAPFANAASSSTPSTGNTIWADDFLNGTSAFRATNCGYGGLSINAVDSFNGGQSMNITAAASTNPSKCEAQRLTQWISGVSAYGFDFWWDYPAYCSCLNYFMFGIEKDIASSPTEGLDGWIKIFGPSEPGLIAVETGSGASGTLWRIGSLGMLASGDHIWHHAKLVINVESDTYQSLVVDDQNMINVTGIPLFNNTSGDGGYRHINYF